VDIEVFEVLEPPWAARAENLRHHSFGIALIDFEHQGNGFTGGFLEPCHHARISHIDRFLNGFDFVLDG
jgi:hypothetical protein